MTVEQLSDDEEWECERAEEEADRLRKEEPPPKIGESEFLGLAFASPGKHESDAT